MSKFLRYPLQALNYAVFMLLVWYFSAAPAYHHLTPDQAVITVAFSHAGERLEACRKLSPQELAKLPPNMRAPMDCPRERSPVSVELLSDKQSLFKEVANPPGLYKDLGIDIYRSAKLPAGQHQLIVLMNDNQNVAGPNYRFEQTVLLKPAQHLVINFNSDTGRFIIQ